MEGLGDFAWMDEEFRNTVVRGRKGKERGAEKEGDKEVKRSHIFSS